MANDTIVQYVLKVDAKGAQQGLDRTAKEADQAAKSLDKLGDESKGANRDLKNTEKQSKTASKSLAGLKVAGAAAAGAIAGIATVGAAAIGTIVSLGNAYIDAQKAAFDFTREVVDNVNQLNDLSAQSGLTAGSIQAVITAFEGSGQSAQAAEAFIGRFPRLFADLASGASRSSEAAARLGISLTDAEGNIKSADTVLIDVTRALQGIEDPTKRATEGFLLLGRQAGQFLQAFGATSEFENFLAITERYGVKTGPEASAAAAKFQEELAFLNVVVKGLQQRFVDAVGGVDFFNDKLLQAIKIVVTLQDFIEDNQALFAELGQNLAAVGSNIIGFFQSVLPSFASFVNGAFKIVTDQFVNVALALKAVGAISNETFTAFAASARSAENAVTSLAEITSRLGDVDFVGGSGRGVGGRTGARDVGGFLDTLLAGIKTSAKDARPDVDGLTESINGLGKASSEKTLTPEELNKQLLDDATNTIFNLGKTFSNVDPAIRAARDQVYSLESAIAELESQGKSTGVANLILARAEKNLADVREKVAKEAKKQRQDELSGAISDIATVASLDAASIVSLLNPIAGQIVSVLQDIGSTTPQEKRAEIKAQVDAIRLGISFLPEIFLQLVPLLAVGILEAFYDGILLFGRNLVKIISDSFKAVFNFRDRDPDGNRAGLGVGSALRRFFDPDQQTFMSGGRFIPKAQGGIRFTGMQDGLAMLHRGEFVVPQSGQRPQQVDRQMSGVGGGMVVNINSAVVDRNAVDALVREIEIRFNNQFGMSSSNLFGGR